MLIDWAKRDRDWKQVVTSLRVKYNTASGCEYRGESNGEGLQSSLLHQSSNVRDSKLYRRKLRVDIKTTAIATINGTKFRHQFVNIDY